TERLVPVAGAEVALHRINSATQVFDRPLRTRTDDRGHYLVENVPQGLYLIQARKRGVGMAQARLNIEAEIVARQDLILENPISLGGKLTGTVVEDTGNLDLWIPIPGARVTVMLPDGKSKTALTNRIGYYEIGDVQPGFHRVIAEKAEFEPQRQTVHVRPFQETEANFRLRKIAEKVGALRGTVCTQQQGIGEAPTIQVPLPGSLVTLFPAGRCPDKAFEAEENIPISRFSAWTNEEGQYAIRSIPAGEYVAIAFHRGYLPQRIVVTIVAETVTEQDFTLLPKPAPQMGSVAGMVIEDVGALDVLIPISEATVAMLNLDGRERFVTRSDEQGQFAFPEVPAGRYIGRACKEGYVPKSQPISVLPNEETRTTFALKKDLPIRTGEVFGSVVVISETAAGVTEQEPIADARVILLPCGIPWMRHRDRAVRPGIPPLETQTDASGDYRFVEVQPGSYLVCVEAEGYPRATKPATVLPDEQVEVNFAFPIQQTPTFGTLVGVVTDQSTGDPIIGAELVLWRQNFGAFARTISGEEGRFEFSRITAGEYILKAYMRGYVGFHTPVTVLANETVTQSVELVPVTNPPTATPRPEPTQTPKPEPTRTPSPTPTSTPRPELGSISGVVQTGSSSGALVPVPDAVVKLIRPDTSEWIRTQRTDSRGRYWFENVPGGVYVLKVLKEGFAVAERQVFLATGQNLEANFVLQPIVRLGAIYGVVFEELNSGSSVTH
ncbi:MAG TPA: carboxypeptidase-like regulatory domain-containing protein, partial [bacterium]|nr:carboxypeptidase-like regulatory domain-containing protein [bacterium]